MRKLLAGAALALLAGSLLAPVALAHDQAGTHDYRWADDAPTPKTDGTLERLSQKDFVTIKVNFDDGVTAWRIEMKNDATGAVSSCEKALTSQETEITKNRDRILRCNWDTTRIGDMSGLDDDKGTLLGSGPVAPNGLYTVSGWVQNGDGYCGVLCARATPNERHTNGLPPFKVEVGNPISAPAGVQRSYDSSTRTVTVTWNANPEPDVSKYVVQEKFGDGAWKTIGERPGNSFSLDYAVNEVGSYQYRVSAERQFSEPAMSGATAVLEVAASPTTAGGSPEPDAAPGEEPGVTIPTDGSSPTTSGGGGGGTTATTKGSSTGGKTSAEQPRGIFAPGSIFNPYPSSKPASRPTTTTTDPGYQEALPYKTTTTLSADESALPGTDEPQTIKRLVQVPTPKDPRALLVPLAGGLAVFVFAMQLTFVLRRRPAFSQVEDDFGDWVGM